MKMIIDGVNEGNRGYAVWLQWTSTICRYGYDLATSEFQPHEAVVLLARFHRMLKPLCRFPDSPLQIPGN